MPVKFISWNVNGIRALAKKEQWNWLWESGAQIIGLQETKAAPKQVPEEIREPDGWHSWWESCSVKKGYSGVAAYARMEPVAVTRDVPDAKYCGEGRVLHLEYPDFHFITCYVPNGGAPEVDEDGIFTGSFKRVGFKMGFLASFMEMTLDYAKTKPVVICGDFNIALEEIDLAKPQEKAGMTGFLPIEREWLKNFLAAGFVDSFRHVHGAIEGQYTWWSYQRMARKRNDGWRIDYFLVSADIASAITEAAIYSTVEGSDHCPVGLTLDI